MEPMRQELTLNDEKSVTLIQYALIADTCVYLRDCIGVVESCEGEGWERTLATWVARYAPSKA